MAKPYPIEFRHDVVRVARNREPGVTLEQIAKDFGVHPMTLQKWLSRAMVEAPPATAVHAAQPHLSPNRAAVPFVRADALPRRR